VRAILIALTGMGNAALTALRTAGIDVQAVITDASAGPGFPHYPCEELVALCSRYRLDTWTGFDFRASGAVEQIVAAAPDVVIIATSPKIVPAALVAAVGGRVINCHPSLLPRHRGPTPIPWTLECGDTETGISYIQPTAELDAGPIWSQVRVPVYPVDTAGALRYRLDQEVVPATLPAVAFAVARGQITATPQVGAATREPRYTGKGDNLTPPCSRPVLPAADRVGAGLSGS
jgi:methionyl-tRNA formyltransferase